MIDRHEISPEEDEKIKAAAEMIANNFESLQGMVKMLGDLCSTVLAIMDELLMRLEQEDLLERLHSFVEEDLMDSNNFKY